MWMPSVELFECGLMSSGKTGDLEPSSNQAGSGEQFKRGCKYNKQGWLPFENHLFLERGQHFVGLVIEGNRD